MSRRLRYARHVGHGEVFSWKCRRDMRSRNRLEVNVNNLKTKYGVVGLQGVRQMGYCEQAVGSSVRFLAALITLAKILQYVL
jgi:hypothetical protein